MTKGSNQNWKCNSTSFTRPILFAFKEQENELKRIEKEGFIEKVVNSNWSTPVVSVLKLYFIEIPPSLYLLLFYFPSIFCPQLINFFFTVPFVASISTSFNFANSCSYSFFLIPSLYSAKTTKHFQHHISANLPKIDHFHSMET